MKKYSANYTYTNHNFVFQNVPVNRIDDKYLPAICIIKNLLQRGKPTLMSTFLQENLGSIHKGQSFNEALPLIDQNAQKWDRIIRGDNKNNYFPAKRFYDELIDKYLDDYSFIRQLIIPECLIDDITHVATKAFEGQQVDFYFPQAYLVIEIDGSQHLDSSKDKLRDAHLKKYGIQTIRITTNEINDEGDLFKEKISHIREANSFPSTI